MFGFGKPKAVVGLDIGSSAVKAVELKPPGKEFKVSAFGVEPVPPDSIVDGAIIDGAAVADAIRRLFANKAFKTKEVAASLSGNAVIVKKINLPVMTEAELAESIYWEAEQYIPFDIQDVNLDYQILDAGHRRGRQGHDGRAAGRGEEGKDRRLHRRDHAGRASAGGRRRRRLRAAERLRGQLRARPEAVIVLLNAGASAININILSGDQSLFTRDISIGGNAYTEAVQNELNLPFDDRRTLEEGACRSTAAPSTTCGRCCTR